MLQDATESIKEGKETEVELQGVGQENEETVIEEITSEEKKEVIKDIYWEARTPRR